MFVDSILLLPLPAASFTFVYAAEVPERILARLAFHGVAFMLVPVCMPVPAVSLLLHALALTRFWRPFAGSEDVRFISNSDCSRWFALGAFASRLIFLATPPFTLKMAFTLFLRESCASCELFVLTKVLAPPAACVFLFSGSTIAHLLVASSSGKYSSITQKLNKES
jgi:hypothetical protein